jgi:polyphosphate kinase
LPVLLDDAQRQYIVRDDDDDDPELLLLPGGEVVDTWRENYPYDARMKREEYEEQKRLLQIELLKLQKWSQTNGLRHVLVFEGDRGGQGRHHQAVHGVKHMPAAGEMVMFDRSRYNRAGVERVMGADAGQ